MSSDSLASTGIPSVAQDSHLTQPDPASSAGSVIGSLPSQPPSIPTVSHVSTGESASGIHQTPFIAPRTSAGVHWAQFTTPAQPAGYKDSTGTVYMIVYVSLFNCCGNCV